MALPTRVARALQDPLESVERDMNRLLGQFFGREGTIAPYGVDVWEDGEALHVEAELPGFTKDQVDVTIDNNMLTITAQRTETPEGNGEGKPREFLHRERRFHRFQRSFTLPATVDESSVNGKLENGVLHLTLNKRQEAKPRKINIG